MKSKKLWLFAVAAVFAVATLPVAAQQPVQLTGTYAVTGEASCLVSTSGFNLNLTPVAGGVVFVESFTSQAIYTFNADGTGTAQSREVEIIYFPNPPHASSDDASFSFTYGATSDGKLLLQPGTISGIILAGPAENHTFTVVDVPALTGWIGGNGSVVLTSVDPNIETLISGNTVWPRICHRTRVLVPQD
jgi:hypothetical protein